MSRKRQRRSTESVTTGVQTPNQSGSGSALLEELWRFRTQHRRTRDTDKLLRSALKLSLGHFQAAEGCVAHVRPGEDVAEIVFAEPHRSVWDGHLLGGFLRGYDVAVPDDLMLCRLRRRGRMWGALVLSRPGVVFDWTHRQAFSSVAEVVNELVDAVDEQRVRDVRARIDQKVLEQLRPKDLFYKLLHGMRRLTEYDHSAALLTWNRDESSLEVVAEQIAFQKSKSENVGLVLPVDGASRELLRRETVFGFDREGEGWRDWSETEAAELAELLDYNPQKPSERFPVAENSMICAPLVTREGPLGVLKVAAVHAGALGRYEADLVSRFLPQAAVALRNLRRAESLEGQVLAAERKHAMADLARGVAHDVNNALGSVIPLVQQLSEEVDADELDPANLSEDLRQIEQSLKVCRRVFENMLEFARSSKRNRSEVALWKVVHNALGIYRRGMELRQVEVAVEVPRELPPLRAVQADVEQLVLNLVSNARDATDAGDAVRITARMVDGEVEFAVVDTGKGISREHLQKIVEPFFTTKPAGTGLGLAICRSIVAQLGGTFQIESEVGRGTTVRVTLPVTEEARRDAP